MTGVTIRSSLLTSLPSLSLGDAKLKITVAAEGGTVLIPDPEVTTFRPCSAMDDFVIIGGC
jgi:hypothetical protein